jgi:hypothetical protein
MFSLSSKSTEADVPRLLLDVAMLFLKTALELKDVLSCASRDQISISSLDVCFRVAPKMIILFICLYRPKRYLVCSMSVAGRRSLLLKYILGFCICLAFVFV